MVFSGKKILTIILFVIALLVVVNIAWWYYYQQTEELLDQQLSRRLHAIAQSGASTIPSESLPLLLEDYFSAFTIISDHLEKIKSADSLAEVFILGADYTVYASTDLDPDSLYFLRELNALYIDTIFFGWLHDAIVTPSYKTGDIFLKTAFAPIFTEDEEVIGVLGVEANVDYFDALTDLKQNVTYATIFSLISGIVIGFGFMLLQRRVTQAEQHAYLNETHAFLGRMVAVVSHEIKNPLMIMRGSAERLRKKTEREEATYIIEEIDRMNQIVSDYLQVAAGNDSFTRYEPMEMFELTPFIVSIKRHFEDNFKEEPIQWLPADIPAISITSRPRSLRQVLLNLLLNGAQACREKNKKIELGLDAAISNDILSLTIEDRGTGISVKEQKKLLEPFYTTKTSGSGLGLYLSNKIITDLNGRLTIESVPGEKTVITITLPIKET